MHAAYLILLALCAVWGLTFPLVQSALACASPLVFLALRFAAATLLFPLFVWPRAFRLTREHVRKGLWLGILLWGGYAFQTFGLAHTTAARSGFLTGTLVPMTPLFAWLLFRVHVGLRSWIAVLLAFAGTFVMSQPQAGGLNLGDLLTIVGAASFALQVVFVSRWAKPDCEVQLTWLQIFVTGLLSLIFLPLEGPRLTFAPILWWAIGITALFATALGIWGQLRYQPRISPAAAAVIYATEPVFAGIAAWLMLGTVPSGGTLIGACLIVAGMVLTSTTPSETKPHIP